MLNIHSLTIYRFAEELQILFESSGFIQDANLIDRRLQVNRGKMLKMYRVWVQAKYRKPTQKLRKEM